MFGLLKGYRSGNARTLDAFSPAKVAVPNGIQRLRARVLAAVVLVGGPSLLATTSGRKLAAMKVLGTALALAIGMMPVATSSVAATSYDPAYHADSGVECWLSSGTNADYGILLKPVSMFAINATSKVDSQTVGWIPALYKQTVNGSWAFVMWGSWNTFTVNEFGNVNQVNIGLDGGGGGQMFGIPKTLPGNYRIAIYYRWFARSGINLPQQDRFEWLSGPYYSFGIGVALYPYCGFTQGTTIIGG
jgi:hypothetical protein